MTRGDRERKVKRDRGTVKRVRNVRMIQKVAENLDRYEGGWRKL